MKAKKLIAIKAESFIEEQFLSEQFPDAIWHPDVSGEFHVFYLPESYSEKVRVKMEEWDKLCEKANKK